MTALVHLQVHYSACTAAPSPASRRIVVRTADDWGRDVETVDITAGIHYFAIPTERAYLELKPCIRQGDTERWARGENIVAVPNDPDAPYHLYPYFDGDDHCSVCDLTRVHSERLAQTFEIRVYVPPGYYENVDARFPVLYMHDGHNLFVAEESFAGTTWRVAETMERLDGMNAIERAIVVGVRPNDRMRQYTKPGYEGLGEFFVRELKPLVDDRYRTRPGPRDTAVMGSSLGGVASLYLGWTYPEVFGSVGCLSSTFGYADDLLERVASEPRRALRIYLDSGYPRDNYEATRAMMLHLRRRGWTLGHDLFYLAYPHGRHDESSWATRLHVPFQYFFGASAR